MADKFTQQTTTDKIITAHNELRRAMSDGNTEVELTEAEIVVLVNAGEKVRAYNIDSGQVEYWRSLTEVIILG